MKTRDNSMINALVLFNAESRALFDCFMFVYYATYVDFGLARKTM